MRLLNTLKSKKGSSLVVVIVTFAVLIILGTTLITVASFSHKNSVYYHREQQAQYTAKSVLDSITKSLKDPNVSADLITNVKSSGVTGVLGVGDLTAQNMGSYNVKLTYDVATNPKTPMRAEVTAHYQGSVYNLSAYYKKGKGDRMNPLDFAFFCKGSKLKGIEDEINANPITTFDGKVYIKGSGNYSDALFKDKLLTFGTANFVNTIMEGAFIIRGDFTPKPPPVETPPIPSMYGDKIYHQRDPSGSALVPGTEDIDYIGYFDYIVHYQRRWSTINYTPRTMRTPAGHIQNIEFNMGKYTGTDAGILIQDFVVTLPTGQQINMTESNPDETYGSGDEEIVYNDTDKTFTLANGDKITIIPAVKHMYTAANGETLNFLQINWVAENMDSCFGPADLTSLPIASLTGKITSATGGKAYKSADSISSGDIVFDTTLGDIDLHLTSNVTIVNKITIEGPNNVYIHIPNKNMEIKNVSVGENDYSEHQLFIEGYNANVKLDGSATLKGAVYIPAAVTSTTKGCYVDNAVTSGNKVTGSITAENITVTPGNYYKHVDYLNEPVFNATLYNPQYVAGSPVTEYQPIFIPPRNQTTEDDWILVKYDK